MVAVPRTRIADEVPGATAVNCGNYLLHDLEKAKSYAKEFADYLEANTETDIVSATEEDLVEYIQHLRLSCSVNNVATITNYSGLTPMINSSAVNNTLGLDDKRNYPVYRSYSLGINIQF